MRKSGLHGLEHWQKRHAQKFSATQRLSPATTPSERQGMRFTACMTSKTSSQSTSTPAQVCVLPQHKCTCIAQFPSGLHASQVSAASLSLCRHVSNAHSAACLCAGRESNRLLLVLQSTDCPVSCCRPHGMAQGQHLLRQRRPRSCSSERSNQLTKSLVVQSCGNIGPS